MTGAVFQNEPVPYRANACRSPQSLLPCNPVDDTASNLQTKTVAVIPARYGSRRLPGKALLPVGDRPLILWDAERARAARAVARVIVATDDARIFETVNAAGFEARMTRDDHASGTS